MSNNQLTTKIFETIVNYLCTWCGLTLMPPLFFFFKVSVRAFSINLLTWSICLPPLVVAMELTKLICLKPSIEGATATSHLKFNFSVKTSYDFLKSFVSVVYKFTEKNEIYDVPKVKWPILRRQWAYFQNKMWTFSKMKKNLL